MVVFYTGWKGVVYKKNRPYVHCCFLATFLMFGYDVSAVTVEEQIVKAEQGSVPSMVVLGHYYLGLERDKHEACRWFLQAARQNGIEGRKQIVNMYLEGVAVSKQLAQDCFLQAVRGGSEVAQQQLAWMYYRGDGVAVGQAAAFKWFLKAAKQDYLLAQNNIVWKYSKGIGVKRDSVQAAY